MAAATKVMQQELLDEKYCDVICDDYGVVNLEELFLKYLQLFMEYDKSNSK
jgi:hypothetical protein